MNFRSLQAVIAYSLLYISGYLVHVYGNPFNNYDAVIKRESVPFEDCGKYRQRTSNATAFKFSNKYLKHFIVELKSKQARSKPQIGHIIY